MAVVYGDSNLQPRPGHAFFCFACDVIVAPRNVRERIVKEGKVTTATLFHAAITKTATECGSPVEERPLTTTTDGDSGSYRNGHFGVLAGGRWTHTPRSCERCSSR